MSRLSRNTLTLLVSNGGSALLSFVLSALIGRVLGGDGLGVYGAVLAWVFPLALLADFGLGTLITRDVAQDTRTADAYLQLTTTIRLLFGGTLTALLILFAPLISSDPAVVRGLVIAAPLILILPFFGAFTAVFRAYQIMWPIPPLNIGMLVMQVILTIWVFSSGGGVLAALAINTLTSAGQLLVTWGIYRWKFAPEIAPIVGVPGGTPLPDSPDNRPSDTLKITPLLRRAFPFALAAVIAALQTRAGTILLEQLTDSTSVGYYTAATRFVEAGRMLPNALFGALFPALAALVLHPPAMRRTFRQVMAGLGLFGVALGVLFSLFPAAILSLTYGDDFRPAVPVLIVAMWGLLPALLRAGRTLYWYALGNEQFVNRVTALALVIQVAFSLWFIPQYGAVGAALTSLITETLALALLWWPGRWAARGQHNAPPP
ncbi:MAG: flippase [Anaerolineaceae bacterium]|nr:flippase [Anaerolineaceae bacterium]